ncbi:MAG: cobalamin-dependent protein [Ignavibacteriaceae bacterium]|jgi:methylmalonyl-CoA mutase C-terminal domain|nr:MAG: methylmalonyl-CoA mutase [Chlorobiota bacterium]KXK04908.1 MAG: methylmalonyl-CoA mutase [Chlorobi bacterium OLB4]MBV6397725.1 putative methylmalonyl-CoA mutase large subunit [Ignavibacteria bacterium]MCC6885505.1 cobalamin-dependent protein [Ignavibacteriales bacterium]MCE7952857.1 methylmalonyl-CoA mutase [Chlorobi bacterium CHB7]MDL1886976.1 methylmalonyl-CoA mutase [Ignavibacteria bacterium CHB1]MEB2328748.1 cobalamin-dependent protein [Ignavibacteriaceae bacterium]OQY79092.1 MAG
MKVLLAKPGLDGHDVGVKVLAHALKNSGVDVVYTGLRKSIENIVQQAVDENADLIGLSILSGTHRILCERISHVMTERNLNIQWIVGGNIPTEDVESLEKLGALKAFPTGTNIETVIRFIQSL